MNQRIRLRKMPKLIHKKYEDGWSVSFAEEKIDVYVYGKTVQEAYKNFWDYIYDLIESIEKDREILSKHLARQRKLLQKYFEFTKVYLLREINE